MPTIELDLGSGKTSLSVRRLAIHEAVSTLYTVSVWARSESPTIDLQGIVGQPAGLRLLTGPRGRRLFSGVCSYMEQTHAEHRGDKMQSLYYLRIVPMLWILDHTRNNRIFQHLSIPEITDKLLDDEWHIPKAWRIDWGAYPKLEIKVQYGESDLAFLFRLWEEAGIAYTFPDEGGAPILTLGDALHHGPHRPGPPVPYEESPTRAVGREYVNEVRLVHEVRPGAYVLRDYDMRKPAFDLKGEAPRAPDEAKYEQFEYLPGGFLVNAPGGGDTPAADDKGVYRHEQGYGTGRATRLLEATRADREGVEMDGNLDDLQPGMILSISHHPHPDLARPLLVTDTFLEGTAEGEWRQSAHAVFADVPFRPPMITPRPEVLGVQTVRVVGPTKGDLLGQQIHCDEFGRVRVQFPWDREGKGDDDASCWMRVSQGWGGAGYGWINLPRVGHEVLVTFLEGDPDRPIVVGRAYNTTHPVPYKLPDHKTISTWKSDSCPDSNGYNELKFEDKKADELLYHQAEKNRRLLVKNDELLTVGEDRHQTVIANELETVDGNRMQVTQKERHTMIGSDHVTLIKGTKRQLIRQDEVEYNYGKRKLLALSDVDTVVKGGRRERDEWDLHRRNLTDRKERVGQDHSVTVYQERHEKVGQSFARESGKETHVIAGKNAVGEAPDVTMKGAGGFIRIDASGVVISGVNVDINVSGSAGHGHGSHPKDVAEAIEAQTKTGVIWDVEDFKGHAGVAALKAAFDDKVLDSEAESLRAIQLVRMVLASDVSTPPNGSLFWSGGADLAGAAAGQLAETRSTDLTNPVPSCRLEGTDGGAALVKAVTDGKDDWAVQNPAWSAISKKLAANASGDVTVVVSYFPLGKGAIFRDEVKLLAANPKVTSISAVAIAKNPDGTPALGPDGKYVFVPVSLTQVLAKPAPTP